MSRTLTAEEASSRWNNTTLIGDEDGVGAIRQLRDRDGDKALNVMGSASLARQLVEHDFLDEYRLMLEPILLGGGKTIFPSDGHARPLNLVSVTQAKTGVLICAYQPVAAGRKTAPAPARDRRCPAPGLLLVVRGSREPRSRAAPRRLRFRGESGLHLRSRFSSDRHVGATETPPTSHEKQRVLASAETIPGTPWYRKALRSALAAEHSSLALRSRPKWDAFAGDAAASDVERIGMRVDRQTVDMSGFPDLVVVYLGIPVRRPRGLLRLLCLVPQIQKSWKEWPDGLLLHEDFIWSLLPPHLGMRQYWRDIDSLERWSRSEPHQRWWRDFFRDSGGTGLWHEAYFMDGGVEAIYDDLAAPMGFARFVPAQAARGAMFSARRRAARAGPLTVAPVVTEAEYYGATAEDGESSSTPDA